MKTKYSSLLLRLSIGLVMFWFGIDKFFRPDYWTSWMPSWMSGLWPGTATSFMYFQGVVEVVIGSLLLIGLLTRVSAILATVTLFLITLVLGINDIATLGRLSDVTIRDAGLFLAALALCFFKEFKYSIDAKLKG